jgi:WD40 repeat protein
VHRASTSRITFLHPATPACLASGPGTDYHFANGAYDGIVRIWDVRSPRGAVASFHAWSDRNTPKGVLALDWEGEVVAVGGEGGLEIWRISQGTWRKDAEEAPVASLTQLAGLPSRAKGMGERLPVPVDNRVIGYFNSSVQQQVSIFEPVSVIGNRQTLSSAILRSKRAPTPMPLVAPFLPPVRLNWNHQQQKRDSPPTLVIP